MVDKNIIFKVVVLCPQKIDVTSLFTSLYSNYDIIFEESETGNKYFTFRVGRGLITLEIIIHYKEYEDPLYGDTDSYVFRSYELPYDGLDGCIIIYDSSVMFFPRKKVEIFLKSFVNAPDNIVVIKNIDSLTDEQLKYMQEVSFEKNVFEYTVSFKECVNVLFPFQDLLRQIMRWDNIEILNERIVNVKSALRK